MAAQRLSAPMWPNADKVSTASHTHFQLEQNTAAGVVKYGKQATFSASFWSAECAAPAHKCQS
jgi:hypothetical protein